MNRSATFEDRPRAKVNLTLEVLGKRPDGYHDLRSIFLRIGLSDRLTMATGGADAADMLSVSGLPGAPTRNNLVTQALDAVRERSALPLPTLNVTLDKHIPAAAGLGGGSSDCASAIKVAQACWGIGLSLEDELEIGASLGSDVPFFLSGAEIADVEGRGERVTPLGPVGDAGILLVSPDVELSTARVFARYDEMGRTSPRDRTTDLRAYPDLASAASRLRDSNDLWLAASSLAPWLAGLRDDLEATTRRPWQMSGSGPTLFALYPSVADASEDGRKLIADRLETLGNFALNAVDLIGPDPAWRYP